MVFPIKILKILETSGRKIVTFWKVAFYFFGRYVPKAKMDLIPLLFSEMEEETTKITDVRGLLLRDFEKMDFLEF